METTVKERLINLLEAEKINQITFSRNLGLNKATVNNYFKKETKPDFETLQKIAKGFKNLNMRWLLIGEGNMYNDYQLLFDKMDLVKEQHINYIHPKVEELKDEIIQLQRELIRLKDKNKQAC